jgi:hypothetical protein
MAAELAQGGLDSRQLVVEALKAASHGHRTFRRALMELAFGNWREGESEVSLNSKKVSSKNLARVGDGGE